MKKIKTFATYTDEITELELQNRQLAYEIATESIVLLKNDNSLPLTTTNIALYGEGAKKTTKGGTGSGEVNERYSVSIYDGLVNKGFCIGSEQWLLDYDTLFEDEKEKYKKWVQKELRFFIFNPLGIQGILEHSFKKPSGRLITEKDIVSSDTDTCIYVISRQSGEGSDRKLNKFSNNLTSNERKNIEICAENYKNTIVVINTGSTFDTNFVDEIEGINSLIFYNQQGTEGGNALADIIKGVKTPSAKVSTTWAKKYEDFPFANEYSYLNDNLENEDYSEDIYVGYRYFDSFNVSPMYEFGYGLSYTDFNIKVKNTYIKDTTITVEFDVKNIGEKYSGKEIVQLYVSPPDGNLNKEYQSLVSFSKTQLIEPNKSFNDKLTFDIKKIASYDEENLCYVLEKGNYILRIGNSSKNTTPFIVLNLEKEIIVSKHKRITPKQNLSNKLVKHITYNDDISNLKIINIPYENFKTEIIEYRKPLLNKDKKVFKMLSKFTVPEMLNVVMGSGIFLSNPYLDVPGSVGNTTSKYADRGLANIVLSDGPAGLRLSQRAGINKKGKIKPIDAYIELMTYLPKSAQKFLFADEKTDTKIYQFTTDFPVGMALAQTWNVSLLHSMGEAICKESNKFGITYWLGPGMNIHRNPLCGRNFEYFSEDPILSGILATEITKGYQKFGGNYATIKHFIANNQEDNRKQVSSNISERALREIYLKGFQIAITEGDAKSVMTSYNKLNGKYVFEDYELCTNVLRNEWGFKGVVMSDWFSTHEGNPALALKAGNDLIMPGSKKDMKVIKKAYKDGTITDTEIKLCTANIIESYLNCNFTKDKLDNMF